MKKLKLLIVSLITVLMMTSFTAFAAPASTYWSYIIAITADMDVDDYNGAYISVMCDSDYDDVNRLEVTCELQQLDGTWETIKSWTESANSSTILFEKEYGIYKNYSYRLKVTAKAYNGGTLLEEVTEYFGYGYYH